MLKDYCKYSIAPLRKIVVPALVSISLESIQKYLKKVQHYMFAYLEGLSGGSEPEQLVKMNINEEKSIERFLNTTVTPAIIQNYCITRSYNNTISSWFCI